jgi:hypothetical protein
MADNRRVRSGAPAALLALLLFLAVGCGSPRLTGSPTVPISPQSFAGTWEKITSSLCSGDYPDRIEFHENGLYFGEKEPVGTFTTWDAGKFTITGEHRVNISTATDEIVSYEFSLSEDTLRFVDPSNCEFQYRRVAG